MIASPLLMTQLFGAFTSEAAPLFFPGAPFFAAALLMLASVAAFGRVMRSPRVTATAAAPGPEVG